MTGSPSLSLIVASWRPQQREAELRRLLDSLTAQRPASADLYLQSAGSKLHGTDLRSAGSPPDGCPLHEVIIVAQEATPDVVRTLRQDYDQLLPLSFATSAPGLSRARNVGLEQATGEIVGFPDDDCWYGPDVVARVAEFFTDQYLWDALHGVGLSALGQPIARFAKRPGAITAPKVFARTCSIGMFYRRSVFDLVGGFDERLGLGSGTQWEGCEDYEFPLRAVANGYRLFYDPSLYTFHPLPASASPGVVDPSQLRRRAASQAPSYGHVMARRRLPRWFVAQEIARPAMGALLAALEGRNDLAATRLAVASGRLRGYRTTRHAAVDQRTDHVNTEPVGRRHPGRDDQPLSVARSAPV